MSRWNGSSCVSSPGHGVTQKFKERDTFTPVDREREAVRDSSVSIIVSNLMGPLGLILTILMIVGVCILIHNHK